MSSTQATIINGRKIAKRMRLNLQREIKNQKLTPSLAVVLVGDDPASHLYVRLKGKASKEIGISFHKYLLKKNSDPRELEKTIDWLNQDKEVDAILVQLPLPEHFNENAIIKRISPAKDADGFHPDNLRALADSHPPVKPAPAHAVVRLIESTNQDLSEKNALVIANHHIFHQPIKELLSHFGIHTDYRSPKHEDVAIRARKADILIVAAGIPKFIKARHIKPGAIVIDVGINRLKSKIVGDVDFSYVKKKAGFITPVPGGVGPMTIACLLENVVNLHKKNKAKHART